MELRVLILVNNDHSAHDVPAHPYGAPLALMDVAGRNALDRSIEHLRRQGVSQITAVIESESALPLSWTKLPSGIDCRIARPDRFWRAGESAFLELVQSGAELVVLMRLGAYAEIDIEKFVQRHLEEPRRVTRAYSSGLPLDIFAIYGSRRNDAASLFRSQFRRCRADLAPFSHEGYVNSLADARDLRQFAVDVLTLKPETRPAGTEVRPGIWVGSSAVIEKSARLVAPVFVGAGARIRSGAVVTRCASVEHHARVDCGTVIENSSLLPHSRVGAGLDLAHSVAGMGRIANLRRGVNVEVLDPVLLDNVPGAAPHKLWKVAARIPQAFKRMLSQAPEPVLRPEVGEETCEVAPVAGGPAPEPETGEFAANFVVVTRRYGNQ